MKHHAQQNHPFIRVVINRIVLRQSCFDWGMIDDKIDFPKGFLL
jgi:hypothetical protein